MLRLAFTMLLFPALAAGFASGQLLDMSVHHPDGMRTVFCHSDIDSITFHDPELTVLAIVECDQMAPYTVAAAVLSRCGEAVRDAIVTVNGQELPYYDHSNYPEVADYVGIYRLMDIAVQPGDPLELVAASPLGSRTMYAQVPDDFVITAPEYWEEFLLGDEIPVDWTEASGATGYVLKLEAEFDDPDDNYITTYEVLLPPQPTDGTIPAWATSGITEHYWIAVVAVSGSGDLMPSTDTFTSPWPLLLDKDGFYGEVYRGLSIWVRDQDHTTGNSAQRRLSRQGMPRVRNRIDNRDH